MNPYVIVALVAALVLGGWRYGDWMYDQGAQACEARHQKADNAVLEQHVQTATQDAKAADQVTEQHQEQQRDNGEQHAKVIEKIRYIHDQAPPSDCLRQPVAPDLDQQLRAGSAGPDHPPGRDAAERMHGS